MSRSNWQRVSHSRRCPVCDKADWCLIARDGSAAICARTEQGAVKRCGEAGWLHRLRDKSGWRSWSRVRRVTLPVQSSSVPGFGKLAGNYHTAVNPFDLIRFAAELGVSREALWRLGIGWDGGAWTFPMRDAAGVVTGIRRRLPNGRKLSVKGGREGLFIPEGLPTDGPRLICEGPTDTAALLTLSFATIGRPSCTGGLRLVCDFARGRDVVVVGDGDEPGRRGAATLASVLRVYCSSVRVIRPPDDVKDARAWVNAGATREDMSHAIEQADVLRLTVRVNRAS